MQQHLKACAAQLTALAAAVREQSSPAHLAHAIATGFEHMAQAFEHGLGIGAPVAPVQAVAAPAAAAAPADALTERAKRMSAAFAAATGVAGGWDDAPEVIRAGWLAAAGVA